ncbi:RHS repeat-associated core domain-containing protein [Streptomyces erythrochromogenes]|uniref:RHS repeat-associated core domain-containing protein n=1 Tax=Streptomyces erythrochromogenes TaxID=285574 RepID=UPI0034489D5B
MRARGWRRRLTVVTSAVAAMVLLAPTAQAADAVGGYRYGGKLWKDGELPELPVVKGSPAKGGAKNEKPGIPQGSRAMRVHVPKDPKWPTRSTATVNVPAPAAQPAAGRSLSARADGDGTGPRSTPVRAGNSPVWIAPAAAPPDSPARTTGAGGPAGAPAATGGSAPATPSSVRVETADRKQAEAAHVNGMLVGVARADGPTEAGQLSVSLDYSSLANAYGGGWASRLHLVAMPGCALTTPDVADCRVRRPLQTTNDPVTQRLTADVALPGTVRGAFSGKVLSTPPAAALVAAPAASVAVAAVSGTSGSQGNYGATSLSASGSWAQSASGAFTYSYPIAVAPSLAGVAPSVALTYNSQAIDGETSARNSQSSWIGDGWSYAPGFIERSYKTCKYAGIEDSGDQCWAGWNATLSLGAHSGRLIRKSDGSYHLPSDDGTKIERLTGASNGLWEGEHFKVTTTDGTAYYLGLNHAPGTSSDDATDSAFGVPVYHPNSGDPCHSSDKGDDSRCDKQLGYRFNLDFVVDPHGNVQRYDYGTESNHYNMGYGQIPDEDKEDKGGTLTKYTRGGYPTRISYGYQLADAVAGKEPSARINFGVKQRCTTSDTVCQADKLTKDTAKNWPDVPYDTNCPSTYKTFGDEDDVCKFGSPSFWSTYRLKDITTQVRTGAGWQDVDHYALTHVFSDAGGVIDPVTGKSVDPDNAGLLQSVMWLSSIQHTGRDKTGGSTTPITMDPVTFTGIETDNRVDGLTPAAPPLYHPRISSIQTETGESIAVTYRDPECSRVKAKMPASADTNTMACYPVNWYPAGAAEPVKDWFHKTLVSKVVNSDLTKAGSPAKVTSYEYGGDAAWHRDDSDVTDDRYRTWNDFRGYRTVTTKAGNAPDPVTQTVSTYLQGMDGDYKDDGTKRSVVLTNSLGEKVTDSDWLAGATLETQVFDKAAGKPVYKTINGPLTTAVTAAAARTAWTSEDPEPDHLSTLPDLTARRTTQVTNRAMSLLSNGQWRTTKSVTNYDTLGRVETINDKGDLDVPGQETCSTTKYASPPAGNAMMLTFPSETVSVSGPCTTRPGKDTTLSHKRMFYDGDGSVTAPGAFGKLGQPWASDGKTHSLGMMTAVQSATGYDAAGNARFQTTGGFVYDAYGRVTKQLDAASQATTTAYSPATGILPAKVTTTYPQPFGWVSTTDMAPGRGLTLRTTDANQRVTESLYDTLGRRTAVWMPGRDRETQTPDRKFAYAVSGKGTNPNPPAITTETLREDGSYSKAVTIHDGMLQVRQQQTTTADNSAGRIITSTRYDSHGRVVSTVAPYADPTTAPGTTLWNETLNTVPSETRTVYDGQGHTTATEQWSKGARLWQTTASYPGADKTLTYPPSGGQATVTYTNAINQTTAKRTRDTTPDRKLTAGTTIPSGSTFASSSVRLQMQADGNLVLTGIANGKRLWTSNTAGNPGASTTVRADGNLVVTSTAGAVLWSSGTGTAGATGAYAVIASDATVQMYNAAGTGIWTSGTAGQAPVGDNVTQYTYHPSGQTARITDTVGNNWSYTYDLQGQLVSQTDPDTGTTTYGYDALGRQILVTDSEERSVSTTYDGLGRKTGEYEGSSTTDPAKKIAEWTYDTLAKGFPSTSTRFVGGASGSAYTKKINGYTTAYKATGTTTVIPAAEGKLAGTYSASASYTPNVGLLASTAYGADGGLPAETIGYGYNLQGLVTETGSRTTPYLDKALYTPTGQIIQSTFGAYGKQLRTAQAYDQATGRPATSTVSLQTATGSPIDSTTYAYDQAGNLTASSSVQSSGGAVTGTDTQCFLYDGMSRLAEAWSDTKGITTPTAGQLARCNTRSPSAATVGGPSPYWQSFTYNPLGDRTQQVKHDPGGNPLANVTQTSVHPGNGTAPADQPNTVTTVTTTGPGGTTVLTPHYDKTGNTTSRDTKTGTAAATTQSFTYNAQARTETVTTPKPGGGTQTSTYLYDADGGLLLQKGADSNVLYLFSGAEQLTLTKSSATVTGIRNYKSPDGTRITRSSSGSVTYQPTNLQGTAQIQVDAATLAVTRRAFDPYGAPHGTVPAKWADNRGYLGRPTDPAAGLNLLGARAYDPVLGRFLSCDPVLEAADPNQMGGYTYAGNDPVNMSDPAGMWGWGWLGSFLTGAGDSVVGEPYSWVVNGLGSFCNSAASIWNGENQQFNQWTGWEAPPSFLQLPKNDWHSDGDPLAQLFGVDPDSTSYKAGYVTGFAGQLVAGGFGVVRTAVKSYRAIKAGLAAGESLPTVLKKLLTGDLPDAGTPAPKANPDKAPDVAEPSAPSTGTPKSPTPKAKDPEPEAFPNSPRSEGKVVDKARAQADKTTQDTSYSSRTRPKVAEALELPNGRMYSASSKTGTPPTLHPFIDEILDAIPATERGSGHGRCGMAQCLSQALNDGFNPTGSRGAAAAIRNQLTHEKQGMKVGPCDSCQAFEDAFDLDFVTGGIDDVVP